MVEQQQARVLEGVNLRGRMGEVIMGRRFCYILPDAPGEDGQYHPSMVIEDEPGHFPMDWPYGTDRGLAEECVAHLNERLCLSADDVVTIVSSSMFPSPEVRRRLGRL